VAWAALLPGYGRSSHVAELAIVVSGENRRQGVGKTVAREMLLKAIEAGYRKVSTHLSAEHTEPIAMLRGLGFEPEALLEDELMGDDGRAQDMLVLAHAVDETWPVMLTGGIGDAGPS
jgi:ribosomal protein S18 acetylase RimI-like enzyme